MPRLFAEDGTCNQCFESNCSCNGTNAEEQTIEVNGKKRWGHRCDCCGNAEELPSTNENNLAGLRCYNCGNQEEFIIKATAMFKVYDDGTDGDYEEVEWDDDSLAICILCDERATVGDFRTSPAPQEEGKESDSGCPNCDGTGRSDCPLCSGTNQPFPEEHEKE